VKPHETHRANARHALIFHLVTVSSSRFKMMHSGSEYKDESGDLAARLILEAGHKAGTRTLLPDEKVMIRRVVQDFLKSGAHVLVLIGGTGVSPSDVTVETVVPFFEKELTGFGELLRNLSYQSIGSAALLTRATAGTVKGKLIVCLPGSPNAVETALRSFILEFPHIVSIAGGFDTGNAASHADSENHLTKH
jgi:molybdenum cofactor biosynthesis protein B